MIAPNTAPNSLNHKAWLRFKRNRAAMFGLLVVVLTLFMAVFAYQLAPDHSPDANEQNLVLEMMPPGYKTLMLNIRKPQGKTDERNFLQRFFSGRPSHFESVPILSDFKLKKELMYVLVYKGKNVAPEERTYYYTDILEADTTGKIGPLKKTFAQIKADSIMYDDFCRSNRQGKY